MKDQNKTKAQLIAELEKMRQRGSERENARSKHGRAEEELRQREERFEKYVEKAPYGIFVADSSGKYVEVNEAACLMTGYSKNELLNMSIPQLAPFVASPDGFEFSQTLREKGNVQNEVILRRKDGAEINVLHKAVALSPDRFIAFCTDITERRNAQQLLKQSEEKLAKIYESSPAIIGLSDLETGEYVSVNKTFYEKLGYTPEEVIGKKAKDLLRMDRDFREPAIKKLRKHGFLRNMETLIYGKGTAPIHVLVSAEIIEVGKKRFNITTAIDITERKLAEAALQDSEARLNLLVENMGDMISRHLPDSTITYVSPYCMDLLGYTQEELLGKLSSDFVHRGDVSFTTNIIGNAVAAKDNLYRIQHRLRHRDGNYVWVETVGRLFYEKDGSLSEIQCSVRDVSERKQAEEEKLVLERQVQHAQKLESLGVLAGGIAHDFNNLLMAILGNADLALDSLSPMSPARRNLKEIENASKRAAGLAKQMLAYSGKGRFVIQPIDAAELTKEIAHLLEVSISKKAVLKYNFAQDLPTFEGDATQIRQVVMNLITNASEAIGDKSGVIALSTGAMHCDRAYLDDINDELLLGLDEPLPENVYVYFEVADTGCGMDAETVSKVFDPFFTTKFTGRGLGMSAVLGIVRGHGGALKIYSEVGKGTTFKVLFPANEYFEDNTDASGQDSSCNNFRGDGTVLIADDEESVCVVGKQMLERLGFDVLTAFDGRDALDKFNENKDKIVCVLLDLTMPHLDGEETFREMRRIKPKVRVILCSGYNEQDATQRFAGKGLAGFIQKPYTTALLSEKLAEVFSKD